MRRTIRLSRYLPAFMTDFEEMRKLLYSEEQELDAVNEAACRLLENNFILSADEKTLSRFEAYLHLMPLPGDTVESRRERLMREWFVEPRYTMQWLRGYIRDRVEEGYYKDPYTNDYTLYLTLMANTEAAQTMRALRQYVPANMALCAELRTHNDALTLYAGIGTNTQTHGTMKGKKTDIPMPPEGETLLVSDGLPLEDGNGIYLVL